MTQRIVISIDVPEGVTVSVANSGVPVAVGSQAAQAGAVACPHHGADKVKPSKFGGVYCTAADDSGPRGYCTWKS